MLEFRANKGVVLASGGFSANVELRMQYNDKLDEKIGTTNSPAQPETASSWPET